VASDADLYDVIDVTVMDVIELLEPSAFGLTSMTIGNSGADGDALGEDASVTGMGAMIDFTRVTVARWAGWQEEAITATPPERRNDGDQLTQSNSITAAIQMLITQQRDGYREAIHHLRLPPNDVAEPAVPGAHRGQVSGHADGSNAPCYGRVPPRSTDVPGGESPGLTKPVL